MDKVTIIGSGLAGCLMALYLARRGYEVDIYEARPNLQKLPLDYGRSINLAMSKRGITGLEDIGLMNDVWGIFVPMRARAIHHLDGSISYQDFGRNKDEYINAVKRSDLNAILLHQIEKNPKTRVFFEHKLIDIDLGAKQISVLDEQGLMMRIDYHRVIAADGAGSVVRNALNKQGVLQASRDFLPHSYKELNISTCFGRLMKQEHLHLWARNHYMLLGNPNLDNSITATLFMANEGEVSFSSINTPEKVNELFLRQFGDVFPFMPNLCNEFLNNPIGRLSTVSCNSWYFQDSCLLVGDAAHAIVPFFGQGMNSAFEDCRVLNQLLTRYDDDWSRALPAFFNARKPNTDAVAAMSMDNYHEIQQDICDEHFNLRKQFEWQLMQRFPQSYVSKHVLVMFSNVPYAYARACGDLQQELVALSCDDISSMDDINWQKVSKLLKNYDKKLTVLMKEHEIVLK